jgi:hypothetical protein
MKMFSRAVLKSTEITSLASLLACSIMLSCLFCASSQCSVPTQVGDAASPQTPAETKTVSTTASSAVVSVEKPSLVTVPTIDQARVPLQSPPKTGSCIGRRGRKRAGPYRRAQSARAGENPR